MGQFMGGYVRGTAINSALMGVLAGGGLAAIGVRYPIVLAAATAYLAMALDQGRVLVGDAQTGLRPLFGGPRSPRPAPPSPPCGPARATFHRRDCRLTT